MDRSERLTFASGRGAVSSPAADAQHGQYSESLKRAQSFEFLINLRGRTKYYDKLDRIYRCLRLEENLSGAWLVKRCRYYRPTPNEL
jgi:hypothetical protein